MSTIIWTDNGREGALSLDGHDLSMEVARDGVALTTQDGAVHADVRLLPDALDVSVEAKSVTVHTTHAQERLLRAGGWAKKGDVCVNADLLYTQAVILRAIADNIEDDHPHQADGLRRTADRIEDYATPTTKESA